MESDREVRCYDYVNHPFEQVRDVLSTNALEVFQNATKIAASRARSVASELHVHIGGIEVGTDISISIKKIEKQPREVTSPPITRLQLEWEATKMPRLFPFMRAELAIYPLTPTETQLDFSGRYEPPLGVLGSAVNALIGHRIAEASVHHFLTDVADYLKMALT